MSAETEVIQEPKASAKHPTASILLPTKNAGPLIDRVMDQVFEQDVPYEFEVVVIDSGSTDGTVERLIQYPLRIEQIPPEQFNHGATRNLLAHRAKGDYLVYLTQDAVPADETWLDKLVCPLIEGDAAGAYGRQVPRVDTDPINRFFLREIYPPESRTQELNGSRLSLRDIHFSNTTSALRKSVWSTLPFRSDIIMAEDQDWSVRALNAGLPLRYVAEACVEHCHDYTLAQTFKKYFDSGVSYKEIYEMVGDAGRFSPEFVLKGLNHTWRKCAYLWEEDEKAMIPRALIDSAVRAAGVLLGKAHRALPRSVKRRCSWHAYYW